MANGIEGLREKVVVITGASSGFGRGAAIAFARAGASVVLGARRGEVLEDVARECETAGAQAVALETDVSDAVEVSRLGRSAVAQFGRIDVWVNNAGAGAIGRFDQVPLEDHVQVVETTLLGTLYGSYVALRQFHRQRQGILINVASIAGKVAAPYHASYVASKHGVVGLSDALRLELEQEGEEETGDIHVCTVLPDAHDTPFFEHAANYSGHAVTPPPPVHDPTEVVEAIVSLATDPRDETVIGGAGRAASATSRISRSLAEAMLSRSHEKQIAPAPPTDGSLLEPSPHGTGVSGGWKEREREEKEKPVRQLPPTREGRPEV